MSGEHLSSSLDSDDYTALESQVDYKPEAVGTAELEAGEPIDELTFPEFGLETVPILHDGEKTGRRMIRRNGEYVSMVSDRYQLVPNENVVHAANQMAQQLGAVPFHDFSGDWFIKLDDHVFTDKGGRRVHALYAWDDPVDIGDGDEIQTGFAVHNSIDKSLSFQVGLFTFRHACQNMVTMGVDGQGMGFDDREVFQWESRHHTSGLSVDVDALTDDIEEMMLVTDEITDTYEAWRDQFVTVDDVLGLLKRLPSKDLPDWIDARDRPMAEQTGSSIAEMLDAAEDRKQQEYEDANGRVPLTDEETERIVRDNLVASETVWSTYNEITESIWHDEGSNDLTKDRKFDKLHRVYEPAQGVR